MWLRQLLFRRRLYSELSAEIQEHLEERVDELVEKQEFVGAYYEADGDDLVPA